MAKTAVIAASANGDNQIVAGVTGRRIRVLALVLTFSGAVNAKLTDGPGGSNLTGLLYGLGTAPPPVQLGMAPAIVGSQLGYFLTSQGNDLTLNLSGAVAVGGFVVYDLTP